MMGFGAGQRGLAALAVGVGHPQREATAALGDVGDARREHAFLAGELLVDGVGDAVGREPQIAGRDRIALAAEVTALHHVPQTVAHIETAIGQARHRAADQRIGAAAAPVAHRRLGTFVEHHAGGVEIAEHPAALEIRPHDGAHRLRRLLLVAELHDGDRQLRGADAGDLDAELGQRGRQRRGERQCHQAAAQHRGRRRQGSKVGHAAE
ncbi:hypothetical protein X551_02739 [Methylibium sp. T29]|nr:hypothetical protein X551_02739 [Methylibium sp. T29]